MEKEEGLWKEANEIIINKKREYFESVNYRAQCINVRTEMRIKNLVVASY